MNDDTTRDELLSKIKQLECERAANPTSEAARERLDRLRTELVALPADARQVKEDHAAAEAWLLAVAATRRITPGARTPSRAGTRSAIQATDRRAIDTLERLWSVYGVANWCETWRHLSRDQVADEPLAVEGGAGRRS
jgi:hypothetical protein